MYKPVFVLSYINKIFLTASWPTNTLPLLCMGSTYMYMCICLAI